MSLSAVMENLATKAVMSELDSDVASVWKTILSDDCMWLIGRIRGIGSRWYPETLCRRINAIYSFRNRFEFHETDAFGIIEQYRLNPGVCFFIDPPYTSAGRRLYNLGCVDNERLFHLVSEIKGHYLMTYDDCDYVRGLADKYGLAVTEVPMRTNHMVQKCEIVISDGYPS